MDIAVITPHYYPAVRGNAVTVRRIAAALGNCGCRVRVFSLETWPAEEIAREILAEPPELLHAFHGWYGGRVARAVSRETDVPYLVTLTGSDVYEALSDIRREETVAVLRESARLVAFDPCIKKPLAFHFPSLAEKTAIIPQGVVLPGDDCSHLGEFLFPPGTFTFFLPAGLRSVKQVLYPLEPLAKLAGKDPRIRLLLAGPVLDPGYAAQVMETLERYHFAHYLGGIGHEAIGCLYRNADVVLNTSRFEGGMANSILEAMAFGKPVLAADIDGNRAIVREGVTGLLYGDEEGFMRQANRLLDDPHLAKRLGEQGQRLVLENFSPEREAAAYLALYREVAGGG
jgi:glycosyltransferase involved in cell wall biosynthesis